MKAGRPIAILLAILTTVGCGARGSVDISDHFRKGSGLNWVGIGGSPQRDNNRDAAWRLPPELAWKMSPSSSVGSSLVVSDSLVYVTTMDGRFYVIDLRNGKTIGQIRYVHASTAGLAVQHQTAVVGIGAGKPTLMVYDLFDRRYRYMKDIGPIDANPLIEEDRIFVASQDGSLYCVGLIDGRDVWKIVLPKPSRSSPVAWENLIFLGCDDGSLYAVNQSSGERKWKQRIGSSIFAPPAIDVTGLYVGSVSGDFVSVDRSDGQIKWKYSIGVGRSGGFYAGAALDETTVYVGGSDGVVYAIDKILGVPVWTFDTNGAISTSPVVTRDYVFVGSQDFFLYALNKKTGAMEWNFKTTGRIKTNPAIYGDYLILAAEGKTIYAFRFQ